MKTIEEIRKAFLAMHHYATKENAPTYMSVPADRNRDADLILSAAIDELGNLRAEVVATKADAARAELRAQELASLLDSSASAIEGLLPPGDESVGLLEFPPVRLEDAWRTRLNVRTALRALAASPDSDERLREVMKAAVIKALDWQAGVHGKDAADAAKLAIAEVLRGAP